MKHMGQDERNRIEFMLGCGSNVADVANALYGLRDFKYLKLKIMDLPSRRIKVII